MVIVIISFLAALLYTFYALRALKRIKKFSLLVLTNLFVSLRTGLGLLVYYFSPEIWPVGFSETAIARGAVAIIVLSCIFSLFQFLLLRLTRHDENPPIATNHLFFLSGFLALALAILGQMYFLVIKGNLLYLIQAIENFANPATHYSYREQITRTLYGAGKGQYASYLSLFLFGPVATILVAIYQIQKRRKVFSAFWGFLIFVEIISAFIHGQRSPVVFYLLWGILIAYFVKKGEEFENWILGKRFGRRITGLTLIMLSISAAVYVFTNRRSLLESFALAAWRAILVPSITPLYFYELFPGYFHFRGLYGAFFIGDRFNPHADVTYADLGYVLQGVSFNPNAAYFAVAYSGLGFAGLILVALIVNLLCLIVDTMALRTNPVVRSGVILVSLNAIQTLASDHLMFAITGHGFGCTALIILAIDRLGQRRLGVINRQSVHRLASPP